MKQDTSIFHLNEKDEFKTSDGVSYKIDEFGVIHQLNPEPFEYSANYVDIYRSEQYRKASEKLMNIRLGVVKNGFINAFHHEPRAILDVGYGDGSFLKEATKEFHCYGFDVTDEPVPDGCVKLNCWTEWAGEVITFWDVFEHLPDLSVIKDVKARAIVMSVPNVSGKNFDTWKHRKPNEHLHHFTPESLRLLMRSYGWYLTQSGFPEDEVRKGEKNNILTAVFVRNDK